MRHEARECQRLWRTVLIQLLKDLTLSDTARPAVRRPAEFWIGTYPSREFCFVCHHAGLEVERTHAFFRRICQIPHEDRKAVVAEIFSAPNPAGNPAQAA